MANKTILVDLNIKGKTTQDSLELRNGGGIVDLAKSKTFTLPTITADSIAIATAEDIEAVNTTIEGVSTNLSEFESTVASTYATKIELSTHETNASSTYETKETVSALASRVTTNEGDIATLKSTKLDSSDAESTYLTITDASSTYETKEVVSALDSRVITNTINISSLQTSKADASNVYTKSEIDGKLTSAVHYKGSIATVDALYALTETSETGDLYNVSSSGENYVRNEVTFVPAEVDDNGNETTPSNAESCWDNSWTIADLSGLETSISTNASNISALDIRLEAVESSYATSTTVSGINSRLETVESNYLSKDSASETYLTQTDAQNTYLTQTDASNTYATKSALTGAFLTASIPASTATSSGVVTWEVSNTLGTADVFYHIYDSSGYEVVMDVQVTASKFYIQFNATASSSITAGAYKLVAMKVIS